MSWAQNAVLRVARTAAVLDFHTRFARVLIEEGFLAAIGSERRIDEDISTLIGGRVAYRAAAKAIASRWHERLTAGATSVGLWRRAGAWIVLIGADRTAGLIGGAEQTADVDLTIRLRRAAAIAIEETVLLNRIHIVAGNPGREAAFVVIERTGAFRVKAIGAAIAVVVYAIRALRAARDAIDRNKRICCCGVRRRVIAVTTSVAGMVISFAAASKKRDVKRNNNNGELPHYYHSTKAGIFFAMHRFCTNMRTS